MIFGRVCGGVSFQSLLYTLVTTWCINNQFQCSADNTISCNTVSSICFSRDWKECLILAEGKKKLER